MPTPPVVRPRAARVVLVAVLAAACAGPEVEVAGDPSFHADWRAWRAEREAGLRDPDAYLGLAGLIWLEPGSWSLGADSASALVMPPSCADRLGQITVGDGTVDLLASPGALVDERGRAVTSLRLWPPGPDGAPRLRAGAVSFWAIERAGALGLRVEDPASPVLAAYDGTPTWEPDPTWRVPARFELFDPPRELEVPNILGSSYAQTCEGRLHFQLEGAPRTLLVTGRGADGALSVIFGDASNGAGSYGGGRFLDVPAPDAEGRTRVDFNRARNPPCAYSPYTTCPLPPAENQLPVAVTAGERAWHGREALGATPLPD